MINVTNRDARTWWVRMSSNKPDDDDLMTILAGEVKTF